MIEVISEGNYVDGICALSKILISIKYYNLYKHTNFVIGE
jgi:hypothetical protein